MSHWEVKNDDDLESLIANHSVLLSGDAIIGIVQAIPDSLQGVQTQLLNAIVSYHLEHQKKEADRKWSDVYLLFASLQPAKKCMSSLIQFHIENYCFLAARNAKKDEQEILNHYVQANLALDSIPFPEHYRALDFCSTTTVDGYWQTLGQKAQLSSTNLQQERGHFGMATLKTSKWRRK